MTSRYFIFGAGYCGRVFARSIREAGTEIFGTTRSAENSVGLKQDGIEPLLFDGKEVSETLREALRETTDLIVSIAPVDTCDRVLATAHGVILSGMPRLKWIAYLSTVGVYGDHGGGWVDETATCAPASARSRARLAAEMDWRGAAKTAGVPLSVLRLSGIYGPGRNPFVNLANGTARRVIKPGQVFNRVHVDDIARSLVHLGSHRTEGTFNVTDDLPAPPQDVVAYAADLMGIDPPPEVPFEEAGLTPMARSFYGESKRVSNAALKAAGFSFLFPDYRVGLDHMWKHGTWRTD